MHYLRSTSNPPRWYPVSRTSVANVQAAGAAVAVTIDEPVFQVLH